MQRKHNMRVVTLGEVMVRMMPPGWQRLSQSLPGVLEVTYGGAEVNVAVSIAAQGGRAAFCSALPDNPITTAFAGELRRFGVDDSLVIRSPEGRFGIYFVENGANQRGGTVTYDRAGSTVSITPPERYPWETIFDGATWFHITGITPSIGQTAADVTRVSIDEAAKRGIPISCDLNFRKKLWNWRPGTKPAVLARQTMESLLPRMQTLIANEEDADHVLGIRAAGTNVDAGVLSLSGYEDVARQIVRKFPNLERVAITLRESISASHNNWGAMLFDAKSDHAFFAPTDSAGTYAPHEIHNIVDRVGAGDAFAGGLIFALQTPELSEPQTALAYAVSASCLKHSIRGDFNDSTRTEIEALMHGGGSGRVSR
jgi:2-dehydro-3-deoxygluconokinase